MQFAVDINYDLLFICMYAGEIHVVLFSDKFSKEEDICVLAHSNK